MTVNDNCLDSANPLPARSKGPGCYCPNPDPQVYVSLIIFILVLLGTAIVQYEFCFRCASFSPFPDVPPSRLSDIFHDDQGEADLEGEKVRDT